MEKSWSTDRHSLEQLPTKYAAYSSRRPLHGPISQTLPLQRRRRRLSSIGIIDRGVRPLPGWAQRKVKSLGRSRAGRCIAPCAVDSRFQRFDIKCDIAKSRQSDAEKDVRRLLAVAAKECASARVRRFKPSFVKSRKLLPVAIVLPI